MIDRPDAATSTWQHTSTHNKQTSTLPLGFEPTIPASERQHTHASDRAATGIGIYIISYLYASIQLIIAIKLAGVCVCVCARARAYQLKFCR